MNLGGVGYGGVKVFWNLAISSDVSGCEIDHHESGH
jgi:hypothetical protein